ncbi:hypothetical protein LguiA_029713 [Lonicera macranthoides]
MARSCCHNWEMCGRPSIILEDCWPSLDSSNPAASIKRGVLPCLFKIFAEFAVRAGDLL